MGTRLTQDEILVQESADVALLTVGQACTA